MENDGSQDERGKERRKEPWVEKEGFSSWRVRPGYARSLDDGNYTRPSYPD